MPTEALQTQPNTTCGKLCPGAMEGGRTWQGLDVPGGAAAGLAAAAAESRGSRQALTACLTGALGSELHIWGCAEQICSMISKQGASAVSRQFKVCAAAGG